MSNDTSDYKSNKLKSSDQIRFLLYHEAILQEIATHGGNQYIIVDAAGAASYQPPNLQRLTHMSAGADERYYQNSNLQIELSTARREHHQLNNPATYQRVQLAQNAVNFFGYDTAVENDRQRFFESKLVKGRKEMTEMNTAVAHVFKFILNTTDNFLAEKVRGFSSRSAMSAHVNLIDALHFLRDELKGNPVAIREACLAQIDKLRVATSLSELRFVLDVFVSVTTSVANSIRLYGGNGMLTNSQIHFKLLERMSPDSPSLTLVRMKVDGRDPATTTLADIRALIKPDLDRAIDPLSTVARSGMLSTARGAAFHGLYDPSDTSMVNLSSSVGAYNQAAALPSAAFDPSVFMTEAVEKATSNTLALLRGQEGGAGSELQSYYGGGEGSALRRTGSGTNKGERQNICTSWMYGDCERASNCRFDHNPLVKGLLKDSVAPLPPPPLRSAFKDGAGRTNSPSRSGSPARATGLKRPGSPGPQGSRKIQFGRAYNAMAGQEDNEDQQDVGAGYGGAWRLQH